MDLINASINLPTDKPLFLSPWHEAHALKADAASTQDPASTFQTSYYSFLDSLSEEAKADFKRFGDAQTMIRDLMNHCRNAKESSKLLRACSAIDSFGQRLQPYFEIVGLVVQSHPEWAAIAWGGVRLVFLLSKNYVSFFEKLARMLDQITRELPNYTETLERLRVRCPDVLKGPNGRALSFIYADLLEFCHSAMCMFIKKDKSKRNRVTVVSRLLWSSFDDRFRNLIERFQEHRVLFDTRVRFEDTKALWSFMDKVEKDITERDNFSRRSDAKRFLKDQQMERNRTKLRQVKQWINPPDFASAFEQARRSKDPGSCAWLFQEPTYASWRDQDHGNPMSRILWLEGKPGFGKTTLSASIIEDLRLSSDQQAPDNAKPTVAYSHFDKQRLTTHTYLDALRAIVVQFIHHRRSDTEVIDAVSLFLEEQSSGQSIASMDELIDIFVLFVSRLPSSTLVLDGVDECNGFSSLLPIIIEACRKSDLRVLLLGRPSMPMPYKYRQDIIRQSLHDANNKDIWRYLLSKCTELQNSGDLNTDMQPKEMADILTPRANSMFLWATLMISYLQYPALSHAEKRKIIYATNSLRELDQMYAVLLDQYHQRYEEERRFLSKVFQFLVTSSQPPSLRELRTAIAIRPGYSLDESDHIPNFKEAVPAVCGALVDVRPDDTIQLVHLSLREFLKSERAAQLKTPFRVEAQTASVYLATISISYLAHDIPQGPLAGSQYTLAKISELEERLPLLQFATKNWVHHATFAVGARNETFSNLLATQQSLTQQLVDFLANENTISAWIEACWTFDVVPSIESLWKVLQDKLQDQRFVDSQSPVEVQIATFIKRLDTLHKDLLRLRTEWMSLLRQRPYEIWGASISAFMKTACWAKNSATRMYLIGNEDDIATDTRTLIVSSKLSATGRFMGVIKIRQPKAARSLFQSTYNTDAHAANHNDVVIDLQQTSATYTIYEVQGAKKFVLVVNFQIELDRSDLDVVEKYAKAGKVCVPTAFASNLSHIAIFRTVYSIRDDWSLSEHKFDLRPVTIIGPWGGLQISRPHLGAYRLEFSECGSYVAMARREAGDRSQAGFWAISILKQQAPRRRMQEIVKWETINEAAYVYGKFLPHGTFTLNPCYALLVVVHTDDSNSSWSTNYCTYLYNFGTLHEDSKFKQMIYGSALQNLHFSPCGKRLFGDSAYGTLRMVDLSEHVKNVDKLSSFTMSNPFDIQNRPDMRLSLNNTSKKTIQSTNSVFVKLYNGIPELSMIRKLKDGAVVRKRLTAKDEKNEALIFLPQSLHSHMAVSVLDEPKDESEQVRIVLANEHRDEYVWGDPTNAHPPLLITRKSSTVREYELPTGAHGIVHEPHELSNLPGVRPSQLLTYATENVKDWE